MDLHLKILAAFHIVFGLFGLMATLAILIVFGGAAGFAAANEPDAWLAVPILSIIGSVLMLIALTLSVPGIIGGGTPQAEGVGTDLDDRPVCPQPHQHPARDAAWYLRAVGVALEGH